MTKRKLLAAAAAAVPALFIGGQAVSQDYNTAIFGHVHLPEGHHWRNTVVLLCPEPFDDCDNSIRVPVKGRETLTVAAEFFKDGLDPSRRYLVVGHKDNDRDNNPSKGDLLGTVKNGEQGIFPGSSGVRVILTELQQTPPQAPPSSSASSGGKPSGGGASASAIAGNWSQNSSGSELALTPQLKLQARTGGSVGMDTKMVNEYTSVNVQRAMNLSIQPDGTFTWIIKQNKPYGSTCRMNTYEEKKGRVTLSGGTASFSTNGGTQSTTNSCTGRKDTFPAGRKVETYNVKRNGSTLTISGTGGVNWVFKKS